MFPAIKTYSNIVSVLHIAIDSPWLKYSINYSKACVKRLL